MKARLRGIFVPACAIRDRIGSGPWPWLELRLWLGPGGWLEPRRWQALLALEWQLPPGGQPRSLGNDPADQGGSDTPRPRSAATGSVLPASGHASVGRPSRCTPASADRSVGSKRSGPRPQPRPDRDRRPWPGSSRRRDDPSPGGAGSPGRPTPGRRAGSPAWQPHRASANRS